MRKRDFFTNLFESYPVTVTVLLHVFFWIAFLGIPLTLTKGPPPTLELLNRDIQLLQNLRADPFFFGIHLLGIVIVFYCNAFFLAPRYFATGSYRKYITAVICTFVCFLIIYGGIDHFFYKIPEQLLFTPFNIFPLVLGILLGLVFHLIQAYILKEKQIQLQKSEHFQTELKFLRSQVNPHFLFNVLNSLVSLARKKSDELEPSLIKLSQLLQFMLYDADQEIIPLNDEVEYLRSYIDLQRLRFGHTVPIEFSAETSEGLSAMIAPMLLMPLVENAFKHGVGLIRSPRIVITLVQKQGHLFFEVQNSFAEHDVKDGGSGIGLSNLQRRLQLLYPEQHHFTTRTEDNLFTATLQINL